MKTVFIRLMSTLAFVVTSFQPQTPSPSVVVLPLVTLAPFPVQPLVSRIQITPDRSRVVYFRSGSPDQLWVTDLNDPITGRRLLLDTTRDGSIGAYALTPDSQFALVVATFYPPSGTEQVTLYRIPLDGGPKVALAPANSFYPRSDPLLTPDGSRVILSALHGGGLRILSIRVDGSGVTPLTEPILSSGSILSLQITANHSAVTYLRTLTYAGQTELYSVPLGGGPATRLSPTLVAGGDVLFHQLSPDGSRDVFLSDATVDGRIDLYSVPATGGAATFLDTAAANANYSLEKAFRVTADSQRVIYSNASMNQLKSIALAGGSPAVVNPPMPHLYSFEPTPDSQQVLFLTDQALGVPQLFSAPILGGTVTRLNPDLVLGSGESCCFILGYSPTGDEVVFSSQHTLYAAPIAGGSRRWLAEGSASSQGKVAPEGNFVYFTLTTPLGQDVIRRVPLAGGDSEPVSGPLYMATTYPFELVAHSTRVMYVGPADPYGYSLYLGYSGYPLALPSLMRHSSFAP